MAKRKPTSITLRTEGLNSSPMDTDDESPFRDSAISRISTFASDSPPIPVRTLRESSFLPALYNQRGLSGIKNNPTKNSTEGIIPVANIHLQLLSILCKP